jgi:hypothetical protein
MIITNKDKKIINDIKINKIITFSVECLPNFFCNNSEKDIRYFYLLIYIKEYTYNFLVLKENTRHKSIIIIFKSFLNSNGNNFNDK